MSTTYAATQQRRFGLALESTRGTAITTPTKWYPVDKGSTLNYELEHIKDDALRGIIEEFPEIAGVKKGQGKIKMPLDAQTVVEFLKSLLGGVSSVQQASTTAYLHTVTKATSIYRPSYTMFMDYGNSIIKKYSLGVVNKMQLTGPVDGLVQMEADVLFQTEADGAIGSPAFPTQRYLAFNHTVFNIAGSAVTDIKNWQLMIDGGSKVLRTLTTSQDIQDILVMAKQVISGKFTIFFQNQTERNKFLANTSTSAEVVMTHTDAAGVSYPYLVDITLPKIQYKAYPFDEDEGLLAAKVDFEAVYDSGSSKQITIGVQNTDTSY